MEHALMCPQCGGQLAPHRFASSIVCPYCGATVRLDESSVSAALFHTAFRVWNAPESYPFPAWDSIGNSYWAVENLIASGDISDVYSGRRARWPTELVILKRLRDRQDAELFDNEWRVLQALHASQASGAYNFITLLPQPVLHGDVTAGVHAGARISIFRRACGFRHTFADVIRVYLQGIPPRASIWVWRRILEVLSFIHASGMVHGAVLPPHLLVQAGEHGVRLVGYGAAGRTGDPLRPPSPGFASFYPPQFGSALTPQLDLAMSACCLAVLLGGDPAAALLPPSVPAPLAALIRRIALSTPTASESAWAIREELGRLAADLYGPPQFIPIVMPS